MAEGARISRRALLSAGLSAALLAGCTAQGTTGAPAGARANTPLTLRLSSSIPAGPDSSHWVWYDKFAQLLQAKTGGQVAIQPFPQNELGPESDVIQQVAQGDIDMMVSGSSIWANILPELGLLDMGYVFDSLDTIGRAMDGDAGNALRDMLAGKARVNILGWAYSLGERHLCTIQPVRAMEDLRDMRIRIIQNQVFSATLLLMGARPTPLGLGRVLDALKNREIDGLEQDAPTIRTFEFDQFAKHITRTRHIISPVIPTISQLSFERLPASLREPFLEAAREATAYQRQQAPITERKAFDALVARGVEVADIDIEPFKQAVQPLWETFAEKYPATTSILDQILKAAQA